MSITLKGVMQAPVTPLNDDFSVDIPGFERMVDFHIRMARRPSLGRTTRPNPST